jgi:hypothetical protein
LEEVDEADSYRFGERQKRAANPGLAQPVEAAVSDELTEDECEFLGAVLFGFQGFGSAEVRHSCTLCGARGPFGRALVNAHVATVRHFRAHCQQVPKRQRDAFVALVAMGVNRWRAWPEIFGCEIGDAKWRAFWTLPKGRLRKAPRLAKVARFAKVPPR